MKTVTQKQNNTLRKDAPATSSPQHTDEDSDEDSDEDDPEESNQDDFQDEDEWQGIPESDQIPVEASQPSPVLESQTGADEGAKLIPGLELFSQYYRRFLCTSAHALEAQG